VESHLNYWIVVVVAVAVPAVGVVVVVHENRTQYPLGDPETRKRLFGKWVTEEVRPKKSLLRFQKTRYLELA
jgi:hypothetical protein